MFRVKDKRRNESRRINFTFSLPLSIRLLLRRLLLIYSGLTITRIFFPKGRGTFFPREKKERLERKVTGTHRSNVMRNASRVHGQISNIVLHRERVGNEGLTASPKKNSFRGERIIQNITHISKTRHNQNRRML